MSGELLEEYLPRHLRTTNTRVHDVPFLATNLCVGISHHLYEKVIMFWNEFEKLKCFPQGLQFLSALRGASLMFLDGSLGFFELLLKNGESFSSQHRIGTFILF